MCLKRREEELIGRSKNNPHRTTPRLYEDNEWSEIRDAITLRVKYGHAKSISVSPALAQMRPRELPIDSIELAQLNQFHTPTHCSRRHALFSHKCPASRGPRQSSQTKVQTTPFRVFQGLVHFISTLRSLKASQPPWRIETHSECVAIR